MKCRLFRLFLLSLFYISNSYATIKIGLPIYKPPFVLNQTEGFDVEIIGLICQQMNEMCENSFVPFDAIYTNLNNGTIDLGIGAITISRDRATSYIFSLPYKPTNGQFVALKSSGIKSVDELQNKKIGTIQASSLKDFLEDQYSNAKIVLYDEPVSMIAGLNNGDVSAILMDDMSMRYWQLDTSDAFMRLGKPQLIGGGFAIMAMPSNTDLINKVDKAILEVEKGDKFLEIYNKYFPSAKG